MAPANKTRKSPSASATKFGVGVKKRGNDGNMWQIVETKTGTKRWLKVASKGKSKKNTKAVKAVKVMGPIQDDDAIRNKNKKLYTFWLGLADTKHSVFIYKDNSHKMIKKNIREEQVKAETDGNIVAILDSGPSFGAYVALSRKAGDKSVEEVIKNYKKYFNEGASGKRLFC
jgi:hypothetical protein